MNLKYRILWFEDELSWAKPLIAEIRSFVEGMGFIFLTPRFEQDNSNIDNINYEEFDLILMDYNLGNTEKGDVLINKIRDYNFFSEILFYSAVGASTLRQAVREKELDGVYCADRQIDSFLVKIKEVITVTVKKVLDLNTIRGIVMAETSDMDEKMLEVISLYVNKLDEKKKVDFLEKRRRKLLKSICDKAKTIRDESIDVFYFNFIFDSSHKWRTLSEIVKDIKPENMPLVKLYENEIIKKRDILAHLKSTQDASGKTQLTNGDFVFNEQASKEILDHIKKHEKNIQDILSILKE